MKKGFTLIELLIVIAIVTILAGVVLIAVNPARQMATARDAERWAEANALLNALTQYQVENGGAVPSCAATTTYVEVGTSTSCTLSELVPDYIAGIPLGPNSSEFYKVSVTTTTKPYRVKVSAACEVGANVDIMR